MEGRIKLPELKHEHSSKIKETDVVHSDPVWTYSIFDGWLVGLYCEYKQIDGYDHWIFLNNTMMCLHYDRFVIEWQPIETIGPIMLLNSNLVFRQPKYETRWRKAIAITDPIIVYGDGIKRVAIGEMCNWLPKFRPRWIFSDWRLHRDNERMYIDDNTFTRWQKIKTPMTNNVIIEGVTHRNKSKDSPKPLCGIEYPIIWSYTLDSDTIIDCENCKRILLNKSSEHGILQKELF